MAEENKISMPAKNRERAMWAAVALEAFGNSTGICAEDEFDTAAGDFLADLMHLCDKNGVNFEDLLEKGRNHYESEILCALCKKKLEDGDDADGLDPICQKCDKELVT